MVLVTRAADGVRATDSLSSDVSVARAAADNAFYDCISKQAKKLVPAGASVSIAPPAGTPAETPAGTPLLAAVLGWADIAPDATDAKVVLELAPGNGPNACSGMIVVASAGGLK